MTPAASGRTSSVGASPSTTTPSPLPTTAAASVTPTTAPPPPATTPAPPPATPTPPPAATPVTVYNVSHVSGRGTLAAHRLRADGYPVPLIGNRAYAVRGEVVYYDPGNASQEAAARALVARHVGVTGTAPRPASVPTRGMLIVVVDGAYH